MFRILLLDEDAVAAKRTEAALLRAGFSVDRADGFQAALEVLERQREDMVITELNLTGANGFELLEKTRSGGSDIPVMIVSVRNTLEDRRAAFRMGADDYMVKPADEEEMILRIKAILRRSGRVSSRKLVVGGTVLDMDSFSVNTADSSETLPRTEFLILFKLLSAPGKVFTRRQLIDELWSLESDTDERTVDVHITRLRRSMRSNPDFEILTVRGLGYKASAKEK